MNGQNQPTAIDAEWASRSSDILRGQATRLRPFVPLLAVIGLTIGLGIARGQSQTDEQHVKAAFLFHFAEFIEWPPEAFSDLNTPVTFCTFGEDSLGGALDQTIAGKRAGNRPVRIQHIREAQRIRDCHVLFVGAKEAKALPLILANGQSTTVIVGESDGFARQGGAIEFFWEDRKIRFQINLEAAQRAHVKISSRLLLLAKNVIGSRS